MTTGRDDDALTWDGDDDPTLDHGASGEPDDGSETVAEAASTPVELPEGFTAVGKGSETLGAAGSAGAPPAAASDATTAAESATDEHRPMGNGALIAFGVLGGVYALYAIGWLIGGLRLQGKAQYLVLDVMYQGSLWLAVLAPLLWFATTLLLTRASRAWVRFAWLGAGVVLLLPWPFVMIGAIGQ
ncbi:DNA polymerase III subunit gamma/tau [Microbacterium trichothecenolyticum]|uniref:DNA polymerase III subunit gamma/tau n=1 Tax=Microbacterium trichothecenolyticum TaxID=69370 RepID=UPI001C6EABB2|nr:DNA polymerase III subunit gamma/tau [Microbacterium trichothecenolyticum]MBW9118620.1 DNA polymerase III subunit gamma/tau [Microbacterium trichothecenolyticum]